MKKFVFCVDSDGCAMDTMTYKHELCFGPVAVKIFKIENEKAFLELWNKVNLYSRTRGLNRFTTLQICLREIGYPNVENFYKWATTARELSNNSLAKEIEKTGYEDLKKALEWSLQVNSTIKAMTGKDKAFDGALEGLKALHAYAKVVIVSSANAEAVEEEWTRHGLMEYVDEVCCQDKGKKEEIIASQIAMGVDRNYIFMLGDSPGDLDAALANQVNFYPILVGREKFSWDRLRNDVLSKILSGQYASMQQQFIDEFYSNLEK